MSLTTTRLLPPPLRACAAFLQYVPFQVSATFQAFGKSRRIEAFELAFPILDFTIR
jgi:hypothetical protein